MSSLARINEIRPELSPNERKIATFILGNAALIRDYSSQNLAHAIGVSQSSIVKFSQKLGYTGFTDLKLAIHESVLLEGTQVRQGQVRKPRKDGGLALPDQLLQHKLEALGRTQQLNDPDRFLAAVEALEKAGRIQVLALGAGALVARNFANMLIQIGRFVIAEVDTYMQLSSVATLTRGDVLFLISFSGQIAKMLQIGKQAKKAGVRIITLTNYTANPIRSLADIALFSAGGDGSPELAQILSCASQQHVLDCLFGLQVSRDTRARELLARSRKAVESV